MLAKNFPVGLRDSLVASEVNGMHALPSGKKAKEVVGGNFDRIADEHGVMHGSSSVNLRDGVRDGANSLGPMVVSPVALTEVLEDDLSSEPGEANSPERFESDAQFFASGVKADAAFPVQPMRAGVAAVIGPTLLFIKVGDEF